MHAKANAPPSKAPFAFAILAIAIAFAGTFLLAKTGAQTHAIVNDPICGATLSYDTPSAAGAGACIVEHGKIVSLKRLGGNVPYIGFVSDGGRAYEIAFNTATDAQVATLEHDAGSQAALAIVLGIPATLATRSGTFALDPGSRTLHYAGVALVALAFAYFAGWIAVSILARRGTRPA